MYVKHRSLVRAVALAAPLVLSGALTIDRALAGEIYPANGDFAHRRYPGSETKAAAQAREAKDAPDRYCQKHENDCW